jgi:hypothetical protein
MDREEHERLASIYAERVAQADLEVPGYITHWSHLRWLLLRFGGELVVPPLKPDDLLVPLIEGGVIFAKIRGLALGRRSECHGNASRIWLDGRVAMIGTGYALSGDGLWRQHSWGLTRREEVVETTVERLLYYGVVLTGPYALDFAAANASEKFEHVLDSTGWRGRRLRSIVDASLDPEAAGDLPL